MRSLPPNPPTVRPLLDPEAARLRKQDPSGWHDPHRTCKTCRKKGTFLGPDGEQWECNCIEQWALHRFLLNAGVGTSYQRVSWDDVTDQVPQAVQQAVLEYALEAERYVSAGIGLILHGDSGTGKTLLLTLLLKRLLELGYDGYFTQFNDLLDSYTAGWRDAEESEWFTKRVRNAGILVVDDIGKESKGRENVTSPLFDMVIRHRVANDKPTLITTNYSMDELRAGYGGAVMSLLAESCLDYRVTGTDYRETARQRTLEDLRQGIVRPLVLG